jgi:hypothetical protein
VGVAGGGVGESPEELFEEGDEGDVLRSGGGWGWRGVGSEGLDGELLGVEVVEGLLFDY